MNLWCMLFANDIVLLDEIIVRIISKVGRWKETRGSIGFIINRSKMDYMECNFSKILRVDERL